MSQIAEPTSSPQSTGLEALASTILAQYTCVLSPGSKAIEGFKYLFSRVCDAAKNHFVFGETYSSLFLTYTVLLYYSIFYY